MGVATAMVLWLVSNVGGIQSAILMMYFGIANSAAFVWIFRAHVRWSRSLPAPRVSP